MIKLERTSVMNFENALRGMRNPMQSYDRADSYWSCADECQTRCAENCEPCQLNKTNMYIIGPNDLDLARRLVKAGSDDRKFLRQIFVSVDVTAPLYWWKEYDTYKVGTVANSTSTMHKIHAKPICMEDFSFDNEPFEDCGEGLEFSFEDAFSDFVDICENLRKEYVRTEDKRYWRALIQILPSGYDQMRTCTLNYENLINIYYARRYHKLDEWHVFCDWIAGLPYFREFCKGLEEKHEKKTD